MLRPHDDKVDKGGEDAFCATKTLLSVADGVGGWADHGVDPGIFSK
jgi:protein phosphatase PTC7